MSVVVESEVDQLLANLGSTVRDFREIAKEMVNDLSDNLQEYVFRMLYTETDTEKLACACCAIKEQTAWNISEGTIDRLRFLINVENSQVRYAAMQALIHVDDSLTPQELHDLLAGFIRSQEFLLFSLAVEVSIDREDIPSFQEEVLQYTDEKTNCYTLDYLLYRGEWNSQVETFLFRCMTRRERFYLDDIFRVLISLKAPSSTMKKFVETILSFPEPQEENDGFSIDKYDLFQDYFRIIIEAISNKERISRGADPVGVWIRDGMGGSKCIMNL